jgi:FtsH-binding integral membrane protein
MNNINDMMASSATAVKSSFMSRVYTWMCFGLALTAGVSFFTVTTPAILDFVFKTPGVFMGLLIAELVMVMGYSFLAHRVSSQVASLLFITYAAMNGLTLSVIFLAYTSTSIASTFFITAGMYGATAMYGAITKRDLTQVGSFAFMGLIGIIIASVVNMFMKSDSMGWLISFCGVIVFTLLTAYDTQRVKAMGQVFTTESEESRKASIGMALTLYLDFINLFLSLLRIFGRRR